MFSPPISFGHFFRHKSTSIKLYMYMSTTIKKLVINNAFFVYEFFTHLIREEE